MRVLYFTRPHLIEPALQFAQEMSRRTEFHLLLESTPEAWSAFMPPGGTRIGVIDADALLAPAFPVGAQRYWQGAASFKLIAYANPRTIDPATLPVSRAAVAYIRGLRPDIIHFDDVSLRLGLVAPQLPSIDVLNVHDPVPHTGESDWRGHLARWLVFRRVKRFVVHSEALVEPLRRRYRLSPGRVRASRLGTYDIAREWTYGPGRAMPGTSAPTVLFFGRLTWYKGLEVLYQAAPGVAEAVPGVRFVIAGRPAFGYEPPDPPALPNGGRVETIDGHLPGERLAELLDGATVVACPYTDASQSGVVLTAYGFGKPVVATSVGGIPEYVQDGRTGLIVEPRDPEGLRDALVRVLLDGALRARLEQGIEAAKADRLSWAQAAARAISLYEELLASRKERPAGPERPIDLDASGSDLREGRRRES